MRHINHSVWAWSPNKYVKFRVDVIDSITVYPTSLGPKPQWAINLYTKGELVRTIANFDSQEAAVSYVDSITPHIDDSRDE